jgi:hypothetical protein
MKSDRLSLTTLTITGLFAGLLTLTACETADSSKTTQNDETSTAQAEPAKKSRLDDFVATGEVKNCISITRIDRSDVLDDQTIIFEMKGKDYYVNRLPYRCPQLGFEERYSYATSLTQLCNTDIITVITSTGRGASCGLGMFEKIEKKETEDQDGTSE